MFLRLFTPAREQKLQALLASSPAYPSILLDPSNTLALVQAVLRYPFALLLTTPRILYQAYFLHYDKKLLVYPRPEPRVEGDEKEWNPSEVDDGGVGVGVGWQQQGWAERKARTIFEDQALRRAKISGIDLQVVFRDQRPSFSTGISGQGERDLVIATSDPKIFTNLLSAPSARHFLVIASELLTTISSPALFERFFQASPDAPGFFDSMSKTIRDRHVRWYWSHSIISPTPDLVSTDTQPMWPNLGYVGYFIVLLSYLADVAEESILHMLGAKFVEVREPWKLWERALARQYVTAAENTDREQGAEDWKAAPEDTALKRSESADEWVDLGSIRYDT